MMKDEAGAKSKYCSINAVREPKILLGEMQSFNQAAVVLYI